MYVFSRSRKAKPEAVLEAVPAAVSIAEKVTTLTGLDIYVWQARFGAPLGTLMWSCRLDNQAQLFEATEKMLADPGYVEQALGMYEHFEGDATDRLFRLIAGTPADSPAKYVQTTEATIANGRYAEAMEWGAEIAMYVGESSGRNVMFAASNYDGFGTVGWMTGADSMDQMDALDDWTMTDTGYQERIGAAGDLFVPASGMRGLIERVN